MTERVFLEDEAWMKFIKDAFGPPADVSECADNEHLMGFANRESGISWRVYIDEDFAEEKEHEYFLKFLFCPNCGKELKEFYEEDK